MTDAPSRNRRATVETFVPWFAAILVTFPALAYRYPAMYDLPCHEEIVAAMRHAWDPLFYPPGLMVWNLGHANQLFYFLAWPLSYVVPVDLACKIVVAASLAATPLAGARLADHLGTTRWSALLLAPMALGFAFTFGFVGNVLGVSLFLALLPGIDRFARHPTPRGLAQTTVGFLGLYLAHEMALSFAFVALVVLSVVQRLRLKPTLLRLSPMVIGLAGLVLEHRSTMRLQGANLAKLPPIIDLAFWQRWGQIPEALLGRHGQAATLPVFLVTLLAMLAFVVDRVRLRFGETITARDVRAWVDDRRFVLLGLALVAVYFELPFSITGAMWLHARFLDPAAAVLAVALAPQAGAIWIGTRLASCAPIVAQLLLLRPEMAATSGVYSDLDPLLLQIHPGSAVAYLDLVGGPLRNLDFSVGGASSRAIAERGGRAATSFTQSSTIPTLLIAHEHRWDSAFARIATSGALRPAVDMLRFRYVLAFCAPSQAEPLARAMAPEGRLVATSGLWSLFESTLAVPPITFPEPVDQEGTSVADRLRAQTATP